MDVTLGPDGECFTAHEGRPGSCPWWWGGRNYIAVGVREGTRVTSLTLYGGHGQVLAEVSSPAG
jgi:hypothetical protein